MTDPSLEEMARKLSTQEIISKIREMKDSIRVAQTVLDVLIPKYERRAIVDQIEEDGDL